MMTLPVGQEVVGLLRQDRAAGRPAGKAGQALPVNSIIINTKGKKMTRRGTELAVGLLLGWLMAGSANAAETVPPGQVRAGAVDTLYGQRIDVCLNELNTLKNVDESGYARQARALNAEMARAIRYLLQRDQLNQEMRSVMDKLYQARLTGQCQSVHNALFDVLLVQANGGETRAGGDK